MVAPSTGHFLQQTRHWGWGAVSLVHCKNWPVDGCVSVCLVLTIDVYGISRWKNSCQVAKKHVEHASHLEQVCGQNTMMSMDWAPTCSSQHWTSRSGRCRTWSFRRYRGSDGTWRSSSWKMLLDFSFFLNCCWCCCVFSLSVTENTGF